MYFTKVELHNFGIYKGTHEMCLTNQIGNRNITLVGGLNGRGTLFCYRLSSTDCELAPLIESKIYFINRAA